MGEAANVYPYRHDKVSTRLFEASECWSCLGSDSFLPGRRSMDQLITLWEDY